MSTPSLRSSSSEALRRLPKRKLISESDRVKAKQEEKRGRSQQRRQTTARSKRQRSRSQSLDERHRRRRIVFDEFCTPPMKTRLNRSLTSGLG